MFLANLVDDVDVVDVMARGSTCQPTLVAISMHVLPESCLEPRTGQQLWRGSRDLEAVTQVDTLFNHVSVSIHYHSGSLLIE